MQRKGGFLWPDSDKVGADAILDHAKRHFPAVFDYLNRFGVAVQAGGNVGVYPAKLAERFGEVLTFEPAEDNFDCLIVNTQGLPNVKKTLGALSERIGHSGMVRHRDNAGAHRLGGPGYLPTLTIDSFGLPVCDLIWLDIEGHEPTALRGAEATIARCRPVVIVEDMGLSGRLGEARAWLAGRGYREAAKLKHDYVMVPA